MRHFSWIFERNVPIFWDTLTMADNKKLLKMTIPDVTSVHGATVSLVPQNLRVFPLSRNLCIGKWMEKMVIFLHQELYEQHG